MVFFQKNPVFFDWTSNIYDIFWVNKYIVSYFFYIKLFIIKYLKYAQGNQNTYISDSGAG